MGFSKIEQDFWDLETFSTGDLHQDFEVLVNFTSTSPKKSHNLPVIFNYLSDILQQRTWTKKQEAHLKFYFARWFYCAGAIEEATYFLCTIHQDQFIHFDQSHSLGLVNLKLGLNLPLGEYSFYNLSEVHLIDLRARVSFLNGDFENLNPDRSLFWSSALFSIVSSNVTPLRAFSKLSDSSIEQAVVIWLVTLFIGKGSQLSRSPNYLYKNREKFSASLIDEVTLRIAANFEKMLKQEHLTSEEVVYLESQIDSFIALEMKILSWAVLHRRLKVLGCNDLTEYVEFKYRSVTVGRVTNVRGDVLHILGPSKWVSSSKLKMPSYMRSLKMVDASRSIILRQMGRKIRNFVSGSESKSNFDQQYFYNSLKKLGVSAQSLRGGYAKVLQLVASVYGLLPETQRRSLEGVMYECDAMPPATTRLIIEKSDLDPHLKKAIFENPLPFACGSIGQVHRAVTSNDERVCIKVQYKEIEKAVQSDFKSLKNLVFLFQDELSHVDLADIVADWGRETLRECDYLNEVQNLLKTKDVLPEKDFIVPKVFRDQCSSHIIVMSEIEGLDFNAFMVGSSEVERNHFGVLLFRSNMIMLHHNFMRMDIHKGNYLFCGRKLALIDMANIYHEGKIEDSQVKPFLWSLINNDKSALREAMLKAGWKSVKSLTESDLSVMLDVLGEPFRRADFKFTAEYSRKVFRMCMNGPPTKTIMPYAATPVIRILWSLYGLLSELGAEAHWAEILREEWSR